MHAEELIDCDTLTSQMFLIPCEPTYRISANIHDPALGEVSFMDDTLGLFLAALLPIESWVQIGMLIGMSSVVGCARDEAVALI